MKSEEEEDTSWSKVKLWLVEIGLQDVSESIDASGEVVTSFQDG